MKFYRLSTDEGRPKKYAWAFPTYGYPTQTVECDICGRSWNTFENIFDKNISFSITFTNNHFADFIACEAFHMTNQSVKNWCESNGISSVIFTKMPIIGKSEFTKEALKSCRERGYNTAKFHDEKPVYYMLSATVGAKLHPDSGVQWVDKGDWVCPHCGYGVGYKKEDYGKPDCIELSSWNGNDLFKVREYDATLFCTEKFKHMCQDARVSGIIFDEIVAK